MPDWLCALAVAGWVSGTAYAFWEFALADARPFATPAQLAAFDADAHAAAAEAWFRARRTAGGEVATVVAVHAQGCDCNRYSRDHVARIERAYAPQGVAVLRTAADGVPVEAAPAALVFDARGRLVYYGPYSDDAYCGTGADGFVERALDAVLAGDTPTVRPILATGCYCTVAPPTASTHDSSGKRQAS